MIQLKEKFSRMGEEFTQIYKDDRVVVYYTTFPSVEVFKYRIGAPFKFQPNPDEFERYPRSEDFGVWAWCATTTEQVKRILETHFADHTQILDIYRELQAILREKNFR